MLCGRRARARRVRGGPHQRDGPLRRHRDVPCGAGRGYPARHGPDTPRQHGPRRASRGRLPGDTGRAQRGRRGHARAARLSPEPRTHNSAQQHDPAGRGPRDRARRAAASGRAIVRWGGGDHHALRRRRYPDAADSERDQRW